MFQINSYLQYKNTPDGKPRVLREGVDYQTIYNNDLYLSKGSLIARYVSAIEYCRPLLTVKVDIDGGCEWTEGDIVVVDGQLKIVFMIEENGVYKMVSRPAQELWNDNYEGFIYDSEKLSFFFDNPEKCSKLLWNCTEEEGWKKVLELLNIK